METETSKCNPSDDGEKLEIGKIYSEDSTMLLKKQDFLQFDDSYLLTLIGSRLE